MKKLCLSLFLAFTMLAASIAQAEASAKSISDWVTCLFHHCKKAAYTTPVSRKAEFTKSKAHPDRNEARYDQNRVPIG
jgi:hypothetical protein